MVANGLLFFMNMALQIVESVKKRAEREGGSDEWAMKIIGVYTGYKHKTYNLKKLDHLACRLNCRNYFLWYNGRGGALKEGEKDWAT